MFKFTSRDNENVVTEVEAASLEDACDKLKALEAAGSCLASINGEVVQVNHFDVNGDPIDVVEG